MEPFSFATSDAVDHPVSIRMYGQLGAELQLQVRMLTSGTESTSKETSPPSANQRYLKTRPFAMLGRISGRLQPEEACLGPFALTCRPAPTPIFT